MAAFLHPGQSTWKVSRDEEGHREYNVDFLVETLSTEGPAVALTCPGLPVPGSQWIIDGDTDLWATCKLQGGAEPVVSDEPNNHWKVSCVFSTKPWTKKCQDQQFDDPLLQATKVSGTSTKYTEEATVDRFGLPIVNSAWEQIRGPQVEFDANRDGIKIEMNVASFSTINLARGMRDSVNAGVLWGLPSRTIKLSGVNWEKKYYGLCYVYYTLILDFDINPKTFDRRILDEGSKVLNGHWDLVNGAWHVDNIGGLLIPHKPGLFFNQAGGVLASGTYSYRVNAVNQTGFTLASAPATITTPFPGKVTVSWALVPGAQSYDVWGRTPAAEKFMKNVPIGTFDDDGSITPAGLMPVADTSGTAIANHLNPQHFIHFKDRNGENCKVILDGAGLPADVGVTTSATGTGTIRGPGNILVQKYPESNFLLLGIPTTF